MITELQRNNLRALALVLDAVDPAGFTMESYYMPETIARAFSPYLIDPDKDYKCGTVACAVGHGPRAGIEALPGENWHEYSKRCFSDSALENDFLFSGAWCAYDNTPAGAAARIRFFLDHGVPPSFDNWSYKKTLDLYAPYLRTVSTSVPGPVHA